MNELILAFLGDCVGSPGRAAVGGAVRQLRSSITPTIIVVNGENSRNGSGISPDNYRELRRTGAPPPGPPMRMGADAITLGDHCYKDRAIVPFLHDPEEPIARPANLSLSAPGKRLIRLNNPSPAVTAGCVPIYVVTVLGRIFMPMAADSPFDAVDRELSAIQEPDAIVLVEIHAEATSEKQAMAWHCLERWSAPTRARVVAVVGTHTHVQTADARILEHSLATITDAGMCGPHNGVIGRDARATVEAMTVQSPTPLDVAAGDVRARGVRIRIDTDTRSPLSIETLNVPVESP
ncbi:MAG: YmdB family metallophosphoesterase [Phycisphaeraceae bacterium]|nr:YmdB family metallophosphoesterase [Phycisphaeraceae bacterium]